MKKTVLLATAMLLTACSQRQPQREPADLKTFDASENAAPGVDVTAAPGVAFAYRYAFRLPGNRISQVQEAHAQACEKLGIDRCRITGMRYRLVNEKDVQAMLALRLEPKLARQFGKDATKAVENADGMLIDQEITGEDVATRIAGADRSEAELREELRRAEAELARPVPVVRGGAGPQVAVDRQTLLDRIEQIRGQLRALGEGKQTDQAALAGTPMVFNYGSGSVVPGFDVRSPMRDALQQSADNLVGGFAAILVILITLVPWLLVGALAVWAVRAIRRRYGWYGPDYRAAREEGDAAPAARPQRRRTSKAEAPAAP